MILKFIEKIVCIRRYEGQAAENEVVTVLVATKQSGLMKTF